MPKADNLFVIDEEDGEELQTVESFSKEMGRKFYC